MYILKWILIYSVTGKVLIFISVSQLHGQEIEQVPAGFYFQKSIKTLLHQKSLMKTASTL